jgi:hypothetical protein
MVRLKTWLQKAVSDYHAARASSTSSDGKRRLFAWWSSRHSCSRAAGRADDRACMLSLHMPFRQARCYGLRRKRAAVLKGLRSLQNTC